MNRAISAALLAIGVLLLVLGINETNSFNSSVSRFFTGNPTDRAIWLMAGAAVCFVAGLVGLLRGRAK